MKKLGLAVALSLMGATAVSAQGFEFRLGDTDRGYDRGSRERVIVRERRGDWDDDRMMRRRHRDVVTTGSIGCRTTVVRRMDSSGRMVKRTIRECED
jgi:hypothetical protein